MADADTSAVIRKEPLVAKAKKTYPYLELTSWLRRHSTGKIILVFVAIFGFVALYVIGPFSV